MVAPGGAGLPHLAQHRVLHGRSVGGQVGQSGELGVALGAHRGLPIAQLPTAGGERGELIALLGRWRTLAAAACAVLLGLELLELGPDRPPRLVELEHLVDPGGHIGAAARERGTDGLRFATDQLDVEDGAP